MMYVIFSTKEGEQVISTAMSGLPMIGDTVIKGKKEWLVRERAFIIPRFWQSEKVFITVAEVG